MTRERITRRQWLRLSASTAALAALPGVFRPGRARAAAGAGGSALVFVHLRGGADGLSMTIPYADPWLARVRPSISVQADRALALDGELALHPGLGPLHPWLGRGELSVFPAAGFADALRSHFDAEQRLFAAVSSRARQDVLDVQHEHTTGMRPRTLADQLDRLSSRLESGTRSLAWVELGGWDTHVAQSLRIEPLLSELGEQLAAFYARWSSRVDKLTVVAVSELGRSVVENGTSGTDDGHAGAVLALSNVLPGGVHGGWPGLLGLHDAFGGLRATTDLDGVIADLVAKHELGRCGLEPRT